MNRFVPKFAPVLLITAAAAPALAQAPSNRCAELEQAFPHMQGGVYPGKGQNNLYRPLPELVPGDRDAHLKHPKSRALSLTLTAERRLPSSDTTPVYIGDYPVKGVPVLKVAIPHGSNSWAEITHLDQKPPGYKVAKIPNECLADPKWIYGGTRWRLNRGDRIASDFSSTLAYDKGDFVAKPAAPNGGAGCTSSNLHTHGLLVRPRQPTKMDETYGDFVLDVTAPNPLPTSDPCKPASPPEHLHNMVAGPMKYRIDIPGRPLKPTQPDPDAGNVMKTGNHPNGIFWYHPHPHGYSRMQLNGGMTGLITVGSICNYARTNSTGKDQCLIDYTKANLRHIQLKDAQFEWDAAAKIGTMSNSYDPGLCENAPQEGRKGQCFVSAPQSNAKEHRWVFTVNGIQYPEIQDVRAGEMEVWRIANASPNVSYLLTLRPRSPKLTDPKSCDAPGNDCVEFTVISVDGAAVQNSGQQPSTRKLLVMPGSRVEVAFAVHGAENYVLVQNTVETGPGADTWPSVELMTITVPKPVAASHQLQATRAAAYAPASIVTLGPDTKGERIKAEQAVRAKAVPAARTLALPAGTTAPPGGLPGVTDRCSPLPKDAVRVIRFVKRDDGKEVFGLISGMAAGPNTEPVLFENTAAGHVAKGKTLKDLWGDEIGKSNVNFPGFGASKLGDICLHRSGREELWIIENWTNEIHNFHLHQSRFRVATEYQDSQYGNAYFNVATGNPTDNMIATVIASPETSLWKDVHHDSVPIPRGQSKENTTGCLGVPDKTNCNPGRVTIAVRFNRAEQVGKFVLHCHILEHEDLGMMATIEVLGLKGASPASTSTSHRH